MHKTDIIPEPLIKDFVSVPYAKHIFENNEDVKKDKFPTAKECDDE